MGLLEGKRAIITGSGRGIGRAAAILMAREGASIVINDLDHKIAEEAARAIASSGGRGVACAGDITAPGFPEELVQTAVDNFGGLEILVNNAGYTWDGMIHKMTDEQWLAMLDVHLTASFRLIRAASPYMRDAAKAEIAEGRRVIRKIVNVVSVAGTMGNAGQANYASAKAGLIGLTKTIAREWGRFNVNCNAVAFGFVNTRLTREKEEGEVFESRGLPLGIPREVRQAFLASIPLGRAAEPEEAAGGILFLVSPLSDYVNGHVLHVDGGLDM